MTPCDVFDGDWRLFSHDPQTGVTSWWLDLGNGTAVIRTDTPVDELLDENAEAYNDSLGRRFGDGKVVASIPLNIYHDQLAEAHRQGDRNYVKRWLNDADHQKFRKFRGNV
ncbi:hypothetical protein [Mesorhizobium sp. L-8-3]|uniref:hypothetical protein n=1 Tax=Mesorhizobium sp. L-8-3 TaxID=2744522 RepID=UPI0019267753|nr:hypothetical protein [Mesorhizobium sp. L-8-3]BCH22461.1 hypothetical protein MesoLjLb_22460 [Mesorhizobium sp. L-8-3]